MSAHHDWFDPSDLFPRSSSSKQVISRPNRTRGRKRPAGSTIPRCDPENGVTRKPLKLTYENFEPKNSTDLAISGQKRKELRDWFVSQYSTNNNADYRKNQSPFLLLKGPPGSAKTTSVKLLADELDVKVVEFDINMSLSCQKHFWPEFYEFDRNDEFQDGKLEQQTRWLRRSFRDLVFRNHSLLDETPPPKLILFESINGILQNSPALLKCFHEQLYEFQTRGVSSTTIVFIISDFDIETKILPKDLQSDLNVNVINFNPITEKLLVKAFTNSLNLNQQSSVTYSNDTIQQIVSSGGGDVRSVMNNLLFLQLCDESEPLSERSKTKRVKVPKTVQEKSLSAIGHIGNSEPVTLVHAIAKVLYSKRLPKPDPSVIEHLKTHPNFDIKKLRNLSKEADIEELFEKTYIDSNRSLEWSFENYYDFIHFDDFDTAIECLEVMSFVDSDYESFEARDTLEPFRLSVLLRGLMYSLDKDASAYPELVKNSAKTYRQTLSARHKLRGPNFYKQFRDQCSMKELADILHLNCPLLDNPFLISFDAFMLDYMPYISSGFSLFCNQRIADAKIHEPVQTIGQFATAKSLKRMLDETRKRFPMLSSPIDVEEDFSEFADDLFVDDNFSDDDF